MKRERCDVLSSNHSQTMQNTRKSIYMIAHGPLWIVLQDSWMNSNTWVACNKRTSKGNKTSQILWEEGGPGPKLACKRLRQVVTGWCRGGLTCISSDESFRNVAGQCFFFVSLFWKKYLFSSINILWSKHVLPPYLNIWRFRQNFTLQIS